MTSVPLNKPEGPASDFEARQWFIVGRLQQYEGETRACLLRMLAIFALYAVQMVHYFLLLAEKTPDDVKLHRQFTLLALGGTLFSLAILLCLKQKVFPAFLSYLSAAADALLVTAAASLVAGPQSVLVRIYFLVIVAAALRMNLRLVWCITILVMVCYESLIAVADKRWFDAQHEVPPTENLVMLLSLGIAGILVGQIIRRAKTVAIEYARRLSAVKEGT